MNIGTKQKKNNLKFIKKNNLIYFIPYLILILISSYFVISYEKTEIHLKINSIVGNPIFDCFFKYITFIGDGYFAIIISLIFILINIKKGIYILLAYLSSGLLSALIKNFNTDSYRPHFIFTYFVKNTSIKYINNIDMMEFNSFPSGHATSVFAIFTSLALLSSNIYLKLTFLIIALLSAFSRTYLSQHWLVDITIGSVIGTVAALILFFTFYNTNKLQNLNKPFFNF